MPYFLSFLLGLICDSFHLSPSLLTECLLHRLSLNCKVDQDKMLTLQRRWDEGVSLREDKSSHHMMSQDGEASYIKMYRSLEEVDAGGL